MKFDKYGRYVKFTYICRNCGNDTSYMQLKKHLLEFHHINLVDEHRHYHTEKYYQIFVNEPFVFGDKSK